MKAKLIYYPLVILALLGLATWISYKPAAPDFRHFAADVKKYQVIDRDNKPLNVTYDNNWNFSDSVPLYNIPEFLQKAFIYSEDKNFYRHHGVDWNARLAAAYQNIKSVKTVRGASTISEQVVKMLHTRPRNIWSRWVEGFEARNLENNFSKPTILEFYLNQIPYAAKRRGVVQAARYYFNRDLSTLSNKEMLALVVLPRSPSRLDLYKDDKAIENSIIRLAEAMKKDDLLNDGQLAQIAQEKFQLQASGELVEASNFIKYVSRDSSFNPRQNQKIVTTLDAVLQENVQNIIDQRLNALRKKQVGNAGALVVDNNTGEILAWVIGGSGNDKTAYNKIDTVTTPRQPGSSLKPFLYALTLDSGWTAATVIEDSPYSEAIGSGLHNFNNYSHTFYGNVTLREALGNSLNIPALHAIGYIGADRYLDYLHKLGFKSLNKDADFYSDGLALGNGEVTLFELVQAYAALANHGQFRELASIKNLSNYAAPLQVYSPEAASLIGNILSDPWARRLEFGSGSVLNLPVQTAVKTGTSTDYRDAWAVGFDSNYTVGVWMGNLDHRPMDGITGSVGPALALRSIFSELNKYADTKQLYLSPKLVLKDICIKTDTLKSRDGSCIRRSEYFIPGTEIASTETKSPPIDIARPSDGLNMAIDPRIPVDKQAFEFAMNGVNENDRVKWLLDDQEIADIAGGKYMWNLARGHHELQAIVISNNGALTTQTDKVRFWVK